MSNIANTERPFTRCTGCGRPYTKREWDALPKLREHLDAVERATLANCGCGSTTSVSTLRVRVLYDVQTAPGGFLVFRRVNEAEEIQLGPFASRADADARIAAELDQDHSCALRLACELHLVANDTEERS